MKKILHKMIKCYKICSIYNIEVIIMSNETETNVKLGNNLRYYRKLRDMTLKEMSEKVGLSLGTYQKYEAGQIKHVDIDIVNKFSQVLDVPTPVLLGWQSLDTNNETPNKLYLDMLMKEFDVNANAMTPVEYFLNEQNKKKKEPQVDIEQVRKIMAMAMDPNSPMNKAIKMYDLFKNAPAHIQAAIENLLKENPHET